MSTELNLEAERADFEAKLHKDWSRKTEIDDGEMLYVDDLTQGAWIGWLMARRASSPAAVPEGALPPLPTEPSVAALAASLRTVILDAKAVRNWKIADEARNALHMLAAVEADRAQRPGTPRQMSFTHPDDIAWGHFADATKAKMAEGREKGRGGWEDPQQCTTERLQLMLLEHLKKGDPVDVANFCMMLWTRGAPVVAVDLKAARQAVLEDAAVICDNFAKREMHPAECASAIRMMKDSIK